MLRRLFLAFDREILRNDCALLYSCCLCRRLISVWSWIRATGFLFWDAVSILVGR